MSIYDWVVNFKECPAIVLRFFIRIGIIFG